MERPHFTHLNSRSWVLFVLAAALFSAEVRAGFELKEEAGEYLEVKEDGRTLARYMVSSDFSTPGKRLEHYKPYLQVMDAEGRLPITKGAEGSFPHHRGIFLGWSKLTVRGRTYDRWHMKGGEQVHRRFLSRSVTEGQASFVSAVEWTGENQEPVLEEERAFTFLRPPEGAYALIEMRSRLRAVAGETVLDGDPEHAGLQFRPAEEVIPGETVYLYPVEKAAPHTDRDYPWVGETFSLRGNRYSVVFLNHPANPGNTLFSAYRDYGRFGAWFKDTIPSGGDRELRVRFLFVKGEMPSPAWIQEAHDQFTGSHCPTPRVTALRGESSVKPVDRELTKPSVSLAGAVIESVPAPSVTALTDAEKSVGPRRAGGGPERPLLKFHPPVPEVLSGEAARARLKLPEGFRAELVASEPMIDSPVALSWDARGRMYVVEMRGYMHDVDGTGEDQPIGRVSRLEDTDGDGRMDRSTVFVDRLLMPRAVMVVGDGVLVGEPPRLVWHRDTDNDGVADRSEVVAEDFGKEGGQPEHMANSPVWMMDNWIEFAGHGQRLRFEKGQWASEPAVPGGQWGLTQDDWGRPYFNYNSALLHANLVPPKLYTRNPRLVSRSALNFKVMVDGSTWPSHPTPGVNRGYIETTSKPDGGTLPGTLRPDGTLRSVTATCGAAIYRGALFPEEYRGNAFVPEPSGNLVKRLILDEEGGVVTGRNACEESEFLSSTDERFRPVNAYTGPDGALYVVDFARGVIQHKAFLTYYLVANIQERKLEQPVQLGRIYRIVPEKSHPRRAVLPEESAGLVQSLEDPNGWVRDTAQRTLVERGDLVAIEPLRKMAVQGRTAQARVQALWTLEGLHQLSPELVSGALADADPKVRVAAVRLADRSLLPELLKKVGDTDAEVRLHLAFALSSQVGPEVESALVALLRTGGSPLLGEAVVSGMAGRELAFVERLLGENTVADNELIESRVLTLLAGAVAGQNRSASTVRLLDVTDQLPAGSKRQEALLVGMAGKPVDKGAKPRLVYLDAEPPALARLQAHASPKTRHAITALHAKLAWPGKPGVPPPPKIVPLNEAQQVLYDQGRALYAGICAGCHQPGGAGLEGLAPPLVDSEWVLGPADRPARIILQGLNGPISVGGTVWRLEMPALGQLSDQDIAGILTYIRREWEHVSSPVSPKDVANWRAENSSRTKAWTAEELKKPEPKRSALVK
jgi:putative membrane-bound dehydrogenase-like protein